MGHNRLLGIALTIGVIGMGYMIMSYQGQRAQQLTTLTSKIEQLRSESKHVSGVIETKIQDSFAIRAGFGGSDFKYEILQVRNPDGIKRYLITQPTEYQVGDNIKTTYVPLKQITFGEMYDLYGNKSFGDFAIQTGYLNIDGIIERH